MGPHRPRGGEGECRAGRHRQGGSQTRRLGRGRPRSRTLRSLAGRLRGAVAARLRTPPPPASRPPTPLPRRGTQPRPPPAAAAATSRHRRRGPRLRVPPPSLRAAAWAPPATAPARPPAPPVRRMEWGKRPRSLRGGEGGWGGSGRRDRAVPKEQPLRGHGRRRPRVGPPARAFCLGDSVAHPTAAAAVGSVCRRRLATTNGSIRFAPAAAAAVIQAAGVLRKPVAPTRVAALDRRRRAAGGGRRWSAICSAAS